MVAQLWLVEYPAGVVKPWATDDRLRAFGCYVTGDVSAEYLTSVENQRSDGNLSGEDGEVAQLDLNLVVAD